MQFEYYLVRDASEQLGISAEMIIQLGAMGKVSLYTCAPDARVIPIGCEGFCPLTIRYNNFARLTHESLREISIRGSTKLTSLIIEKPFDDFLEKVKGAEDLQNGPIKHADFKRLSESQEIIVKPHSEIRAGITNKKYGEHPVFIMHADFEKIRKLQKDTSNIPKQDLSTKTKNLHAKTIYALSLALLGELSGKKTKDADSVLAKLDQLGIPRPISSRSLSELIEDGKEEI